MPVDEKNMEAYRSRCTELASRLSLLPYVTTSTRSRSLPRSHLPAGILHELYGMDVGEASIQEIGDAFLRSVAGVWHAKGAALMEYDQERGVFEPRHTVGRFSEGKDISFAHGDAPEFFCCVCSDEKVPPLARRLCSLTGNSQLLWTFSLPAGMGLLMGNDTDAGSSTPPFVEADREIVEDLLNGYAHLRERRWAEQVLRESERRYRLFAENVSDIIWTMNKDFRFTYISPSSIYFTGHAPEEIMAMNLQDYLTSISFDIAVRSFLEAFAREQVEPYWSETLELEHRCKDGTTAWAEVNYTSLLDEKGTFTGLLGVTRDISDRKRAEEALRRSEEQLRQAQKLEAVGRLAGGIAHDFNNLMTIINGYCDYLLMRVGKQSPLHAEILEIKNAGTRAASLTRQLVAFSRRQRLQQKLMDLNGLLEDMSSVLRRLISEDNKLVILLEQDLDRIRADSGQIHQVVLNLSLNASDAMPQGGTLTIQTRNVVLGDQQSLEISGSRPGRFVCLSVSDTGIGMDKEVREQIFEPFFSTKKVGEGSGLGLSTVYGIVKQHHGWIRVSSELGKGTTFEIHLPAFSEKLEEEEVEALNLDGLKGRGERILLVEDDRNVSEFAARVLTENGYEVLVASNSEHALTLFHREGARVELVFSDVVLPGKSGVQLVEHLLSLDAALRVLLCSGHRDDKSQRSMIEERGFRFLQKPYSMGGLLQAVKEVMA